MTVLKSKVNSKDIKFLKNQKQKATEFYEKIIASENTNPDINKEVQKRLNRDFSE